MNLETEFYGGGPKKVSRFTDSPNLKKPADGRKGPTLLPRQRLAIPNKHSTSNGDSGSGLVLLVQTETNFVCENKPLVQWDDDDDGSEEELSFFPSSNKKSTLTDNLSIENMSLSDDEDLHLTPPKNSGSCPCDPRLLFLDKGGWLKAKNSNAGSFNRNRQCSVT